MRFLHGKDIKINATMSESVPKHVKTIFGSDQSDYSTLNILSIQEPILASRLYFEVKIFVSKWLYLLSTSDLRTLYKLWFYYLIENRNKTKSMFSKMINSHWKSCSYPNVRETNFYIAQWQSIASKIIILYNTLQNIHRNKIDIFIFIFIVYIF